MFHDIVDTMKLSMQKEIEKILNYIGEDYEDDSPEKELLQRVEACFENFFTDWSKLDGE
jgi:hypothetical protein